MHSTDSQIHCDIANASQEKRKNNVEILQTRRHQGPPGATRGELRLKLNFIQPSEVIGDSYCEQTLKAHAKLLFFFCSRVRQRAAINLPESKGQERGET